MTIAELSGRHRQSPIGLGGEDQSLGTKDRLITEAMVSKIQSDV